MGTPREIAPENASTETVSLFLTALVTLRKNFLLLLGGAAWWSSHYLTFWDSSLVMRGTYVQGLDRIWLISVAATVLVLGVATLLLRNKPDYTLSKRRWPYMVMAICLTAGLLALMVPTADGLVLATVGAALTGFGNSFCHIIFGELHTKMGKVFIPLACAVESATGVAMYAFFVSLPTLISLSMALVFALLSVVLYRIFAYRQDKILEPVDISVVPAATVKPEVNPEVRPEVKPEVKPAQLAIFAVLIGLTYGFVRTFMSNNSQDWLGSSLPFELLGTLLAAALLVAVFFLQYKRTLLELCFIFVIPFVATGMLLLPFYSVSSALPTLINTGGFACFFMLLWYCAAAVSRAKRSCHVSFLIALLFFCIQFGQMVGALVPPGWVNILSTEFIYVLLLFSVFFFLRQRRKGRDKNTENTTQTVMSDEKPLAQLPDDRLAHRLNLSPREVEVLALLLKRAPYKQIEKELVVSANTVKTHVRSIYKKAEVSSREELLELLANLANNG